jgi:hypothetical protein
MDTTAGTYPDYIFGTFPVAFASVGAASGASYAYTLNDTNTTAIDSIGGANGTYSGTYSQSQTALSSDATFSTNFTNGQVTLPINDINGTNSFSIEFLANITNATAHCTLNNACTFIANTTYANYNVSGWAIDYNAQTNIFVLHLGNGVGCSIGAGPVAAATTYDIAATYNSVTGACVLYVQGVAIASGSNSYVTGGQPITIGNAISAANASPNARMQSVFLYPYALTAAQVAAHYSAYVGSGWIGLPGTVSASGPLIATTVAGSQSGITCPTCLSLSYINSTPVVGGSHDEVGQITVNVGSTCLVSSGCSITGNSVTFQKPFTSTVYCQWTAADTGYRFVVQDVGDTTTTGTMVLSALTTTIPASTNVLVNYDCKGV